MDTFLQKLNKYHDMSTILFFIDVPNTLQFSILEFFICCYTETSFKTKFSYKHKV